MKVYSFYSQISILALALTFTGCASSRLPFLPQKEANDFADAINAFNYPDDVRLHDISERENINGPSPDKIVMKTLTQSFAKGWNFALKDGKIWAKKDSEKDWSLFLKTGLPFSKAKTKLPGSGWFESPERIVEIGADGDSLYAFDDKGRLYKVFTEKATAEGKFNWVTGYGWPEKKQLVQNPLVENKRGWAMGTRRKDVLWYEDIFKNQHHYGTMGLETIYFLTKDGNEIRFTDSGLPVDLSKTIQMPEDGAFIARNIACSASTLFLIGDDGTMYTRLIDFDTMGCDPMFFKYTYDEEVAKKQKHTGNNYLSNYDPWGLPAEPWKKEAGIPLSGQAAISRFITIFQTGKGNEARTLRVAGTDQDGCAGYYEKSLDDESWTFVPCALRLQAEDFLTGDAKRAEKREYRYEGFASSKDKRRENVSVAVRDFSLTHEGDCTLSITMRGSYKEAPWSETKELHLYTVAMWTYTQKINPGLDGTPKDFFVSLDAEKSDLKTEHEEFTSYLSELFSKNCKKTFALTAQATDAYLHITIPTARGTKEVLFLNRDGKETATQADKTLPTDIYRLDALSEQTLAGFYSDSSLVLSDRIYSQGDIKEIRTCIERNYEYKQNLESDLTYYEEKSRKSEKRRRQYQAVDFLTKITLLNQIDFPKIKTMTSHGSTLIKSNADSYKELVESRALTYPPLIELVSVRIKSYERLLSALESVAESAHKESIQKDSYPDYFASVNIPEIISGESKSAGRAARLYQLPELPTLAGFYLQIDGGISIYVALEDAAEAFYEAAQARNKDEKALHKELSIPVHFIVLDDIGSTEVSSAGILALESRKGKLTWNGEKLTIRVKHGLTYTTLFSAL